MFDMMSARQNTQNIMETQHVVKVERITTLVNVKMGDRFWYVSAVAARNNRDVMVTKIGRKFVYMDGDLKFGKEDAIEENGYIRGSLYESREGYERWIDHQFAVQQFKKKIADRITPYTVTLDQLQRLNAILEEVEGKQS